MNQSVVWLQDLILHTRMNHNATLQEIADVLDVSKQTVRQMEIQAMRRKREKAVNDDNADRARASATGEG